ncbi:MAG: CCA tRNA nucleotidyltransferase [Rhodospirillales bacterium]|nr:CCA tRNA nucleotidyltransferase [Rhodospirillales bacterium]
MPPTETALERIALPPRLSDSAARKVVAALTADGSEVRFVGGCVRDAILGRELDDVDFATPDRPETVMALLEAAGIKAVSTGLKHGTVTAVASGMPFEITTLRLDVETDGRHAEVTFTDSFEADAARRDFTFNAMSMNADGDLFDYFGGRADLDAGLVRFVGVASERVAEDYLRVLRYFRFLARYGRGAPDETAVAACRDSADRLGRLSAERVQAELLKILVAPNPVPALGLMAETGVLAAVLPEAESTESLLALTGVDDRDPLRRLAALAPHGGSGIARRLRLSNAQAERLAAMSPPVRAMMPTMTDVEQRQALYDLGVDLVRDLILLAWAGDRGGHADRWRAMLDHAGTWQRPVFPIRGSDAIAAGIPAGPAVGELLGMVEGWWREQDFAPGRQDCLDRLQVLAAEQV